MYRQCRFVSIAVVAIVVMFLNVEAYADPQVYGHVAPEIDNSTAETKGSTQAGNTLNVGLMPQNAFQLNAIVDRLERQASAAIYACDKVAYEDALETLDDIDFDIGGLGGLIDDLDAAWNAACGSVVKKNPFEFSLGPKVGVFSPKSMSYLGTRVGAGPDILDFVRTKNDLGFIGLSGRFTYELGNTYNTYNTYNLFNMFNIFNILTLPLKIITGFDIAETDLHQSFDQIDANGATLLVPGVGVGPNGAGFTLAGPNNQITGAQYDAEGSFQDFYLGLESRVQTKVPGVSITPSLGMKYGRYSGDYSFQGTIPIFVRDFRYDTEIDVHSFSPTIGVDVNWMPDSRFEFFGGVKYSYDFNTADGTDTLHFTGFNDQKANMSNNDNTHSHSATAGMRINPNGPITFSLEGSYKRFGNIPELNVRDGINESDFELESADMYQVGLYMKMAF